MVRATQEGIAFAFRYGLDIMRENGIDPNIIRAGRSNLFLSEVFTTSFVNVTNVAIEFYEGDGSFGAAIGAGIGAGIFDAAEPFRNRTPVGFIQPDNPAVYDALYKEWKDQLNERIKKEQETLSI
jgi:xylulokinase